MTSKITNRWVPVFIDKSTSDEYYITKYRNYDNLLYLCAWWGRNLMGTGEWRFKEVFDTTSEYPALDKSTPILNYSTHKRAQTAIKTLLNRVATIDVSPDRYGYPSDKDSVEYIRKGLTKILNDYRVEFREIEFVKNAVKFDSSAAKRNRIVINPGGKFGQSKCAACGVKLRDIPYVTTNDKPANICIPCLHEVIQDIEAQYNSMPQDTKDAIEAGKFMHKI